MEKPQQFQVDTLSLTLEGEAEVSQVKGLFWEEGLEIG